MTKKTAKKAIDYLFECWYEKKDIFSPGEENIGVILDFIGGEPLMNIPLIDYICTYFFEKCITEHHPWALTWQANMISNGTYYFNPDFQNFLKKFNHHCNFNVTLDGPQKIHDTCRKYPDGEGNFNDAFKALQHYRQNFRQETNTKITVSPENLSQLSTVAQFFIEQGIVDINLNPAFEPEWTIEQGQEYYNQLKQIADYLLSLDEKELLNIDISIFNDTFYEKLKDNDVQNWCGGDGRMIAIDPFGDIYPCIRYTASSLGNERSPLKIGDVNHGIYQTQDEKIIQATLNCLTRKTQSTEECFNCSIGAGCSWCSAWNYQKYGDVNHRSTGICNMHKAAALANVYYWNKYYKKFNQKKVKSMNLSQQEALKFIDQKEYDFLLSFFV